MFRARASLDGQASIESFAISRVADGLIVAALVVMFLYYGGAVLQPLAIAALLSLILSPLILRLRRVGLPRTPSVVVVVLSAVTLLGALGWTMTSQISDLAMDLPKYETNLREKMKILKGFSAQTGALDRASETLSQLNSEVGNPAAAAPSAPVSQLPPGEGTLKVGETSKPVIVEVRQPGTPTLETVGSLLKPLVSPLATTGLVFLFLMFILLEREELRDRVLRLAGTTDLQRSTAAMDDAGKRLSRFFLMQTGLNIAFGIVIGTGLWIIGVPNPVLWGILAGIMRFVPFIGSLIAAAFPIALAAAVDPTWNLALLTGLLFLIAEPLAGHVIEPVLYGRHTGLSPVAIVVTTLFWTVLWGPIGLLLATPLTVCLVVLGKHVKTLAFIDVLLGDEPALEPEERLFQRFLAGDADDAADQAESAFKSSSVVRYYDDVALEALGLAYAAATAGKLAETDQTRLDGVVAEMIEDLEDHEDDGFETDGLKKERINEVYSMPQKTSRVTCVAARSPIDHAANLFLADVLRRRGVEAVTLSYGSEAASHFEGKRDEREIVVVSCFGIGTTPAHVRYLIRRLRRAQPNAYVVAALWLLDQDSGKTRDWQDAVGADAVVHTISDAADICSAHLRQSVDHEDGDDEMRADAIVTAVA